MYRSIIVSQEFHFNFDFKYTWYFSSEFNSDLFAFGASVFFRHVTMVCCILRLYTKKALSKRPRVHMENTRIPNEIIIITDFDND